MYYSGRHYDESGTDITQAMGQMNRSLNLPQIQRIMNDFEKESSTMDMKEEMMSDAVDDAMEAEDEGEGEEMEGDKILKEVLDEIGMSMNEAVCLCSCPFHRPASLDLFWCIRHSRHLAGVVAAVQGRGIKSLPLPVGRNEVIRPDIASKS